MAPGFVQWRALWPGSDRDFDLDSEHESRTLQEPSFPARARRSKPTASRSHGRNETFLSLGKIPFSLSCCKETAGVPIALGKRKCQKTLKRTSARTGYMSASKRSK